MQNYLLKISLSAWQQLYKPTVTVNISWWTSWCPWSRRSPQSRWLTEQSSKLCLPARIRRKWLKNLAENKPASTYSSLGSDKCLSLKVNWDWIPFCSKIQCRICVKSSERLSWRSEITGWHESDITYIICWYFYTGCWIHYHDYLFSQIAIQ